MTFERALTAPVEHLLPRQIWQAIQVIGTRKLTLRQTRHFSKILDVLAPLNKRIDNLWREDESRRRKNDPIKRP